MLRNSSWLLKEVHETCFFSSSVILIVQEMRCICLHHALSGVLFLHSVWSSDGRKWLCRNKKVEKSGLDKKLFGIRIHSFMWNTVICTLLLHPYLDFIKRFHCLITASVDCFDKRKGWFVIYSSFKVWFLMLQSLIAITFSVLLISFTCWASPSFLFILLGLQTFSIPHRGSILG